MREARDLLGGAAAWLFVLSIGRILERAFFPSATSLRRVSLLEAAAVSIVTIGLLVVANRWRAWFVISPRAAFVVAVLCVFQWIWLVGLQPWWVESESRLRFEARYSVLMLLIEAAAPALLGAVIWLVFLGRVSAGRRVALIGTTVLASLIAVWVISPEVVRGTLEQAQWLKLESLQHLSGAHTSPLPRHVGYIVVAVTTGLLFYVVTRHQKAHEVGRA